MFGVELYWLILIYKIRVVLAEQRVCVAAVVVSLGILGIEFDCLGIILYRQLMVAQPALRETTAGIYFRVLGAKFLSLIEILNRFFELAQARVGFTPLVVGFS